MKYFFSFTTFKTPPAILNVLSISNLHKLFQIPLTQKNTKPSNLKTIYYVI